MKFILPFLLLVATTFSCGAMTRYSSTATGAFIGAMVGGPPGAMIGAAIGLGTGEAVVAEVFPVDEPEVVPTTGAAGLMYQITQFISTIGWWFLILFFVLPLFSVKIRDYLKKVFNKLIPDKTKKSSRTR